MKKEVKMMLTEEEIRKDIVRKMKKIGTYNKSYTYTIETLSRTIFDYQNALALFDQSGGHIVMQYTNKSGSTGLLKNPIYQSLEKLRSDIVLFSRELGLTPSSKKIDGVLSPSGSELLKFLNK